MGAGLSARDRRGAGRHRWQGRQAAQCAAPGRARRRLGCDVGDAPASARVFPITERRINYIVKAAAQRAGINPAASAHWVRHAHASHAIDEGAPITLVSHTLGHADLKATSVYAHAKPNDSSSRYLKRT
jgi:site-specific recombinase XerC